MSNKNSYSELKELLKSTTMELTRDTHKWQDFLKSSSKLYKYNFSEQISIYAQNPKATACADFDLWNEKMNRRIKRGEKSIRLVDDKSGQIKHVFDISQTYANERSKTPYLWQSNDENESVIIKALHDRYDVPKDNLINMIFSSAKSAAEDIKSDYLSELKYVVSDSLLADFDDLNLNVIFSRILENSVAYSLLVRCDINPDLYLTREDFADLYNFSNLETLSILGAATSEVSEQILREIEKAVKSYEIEKIKAERGMNNEANQKDIRNQHSQGNDIRGYTPRSVSGRYEVLSRSDGGERDSLQTRRTDIPISSAIGITGHEPGHREVRSIEARLSEESQERLSDTIEVGGQTQSLSSGNQRNSTQSDRANDGRNADQRTSTTARSGLPSTRSAQERNDSIGGGDNSKRDDLQLNSETAEENVTSAVLMSEPIVTILWSEHPELTKDDEIPLSVANELFRELDLKQNTERNNPDLNVGWYKKTAFSIKSIINGEEHIYEGRQDLGDGEGSLLNHIKNHCINLSEDTGFHSHYKNLGDEKYQEFLDENTFVLNTLIPYYESHIEITNIKAEAEKNNIIESVSVHEEKSLELLNTKENIEQAIDEIHEIRKTHDDSFINSAIQLTLFDEPIIENGSNQHNLAIISQDVIDEVISNGGKEINSIHNIIAQYQKGKSIEANAEFLKNEFKTGGRGHIIDNRKYAVWFESNGIKIGLGTRAENAHSSTFLSWTDMAKRIGELLDEGKFSTQINLSSAWSKEVKSVANGLWSLHQDYNFDRPEKFFIPEEIFQGGYAENIAKLSEQLTDKGVLRDYINGLKDLTALHEQEPNVIRFRFHNPKKLLSRLEDLQIEPKVFHAEPSFEPNSKFYISDDEITHLIHGGANVQDSKFRVNDFFKANKDIKDRLTFLKKEYGIGGSSYSGFTEMHDGKGISYERKYHNGEKEKIHLKWNEVAKQISAMVKADKYITVADIESRVRHANYVLENYNSNNSSDKYYIEEAKQVLAKYKNDEPTKETNVHLAQTQSVGRADEKDNVPKSPRPSTSIKQQNYKITEESFGVKGRTDRLNSNVQAISLLKQLEKDKRLATPEEQNILAQYTGWGSLPQVFDEQNNSFANQRKQLRELLTEDEYNSAMASTLNAHYTAPVVISAIYEAIDKMGFESGNILEPSCGTGNFFGLLPEKMQDSKLFGVELDSITGRIAQQLYPNANIAVTGFEKKEYPDNFFDITIGNVPFGGFKVHDQHYDKHNFLIHDYFIAKSLDKVRPGGVVAIVTSKGTMDKKNPTVRKYIAKRAELVGAVRLPNNAFKANAGTEVTADILFFQKRDRMIDIEPDWIHLGKNENGLTINQYFIDNPQMVLGEIIEGNKLYGNKSEVDTMCVPFEGAVLKEQLKIAVSNIKATIPEKSINTVLDDIKIENSIPADPNVKNLSYAIVDDNLYYRQNSTMDLVEVPVATAERIKGMVEIRDCLRTLIDSQLNNERDIVIENQQNLLNSVYDNFTQKHGHINERANKKVFKEDSSLPLILSLENIEDGKFVGKADIFTKRTIKPIQPLTSVDTATEALAVSIAEKGRIDMPFMSKLSSKSESVLENELKGVIFRNIKCSSIASNISKDDAQIEKYPLVTADEYLSGNVREKLMMAKAMQSVLPESEKGKISENINALQQAQPKALQASDIDVRLGATWIDTNIINKFIYETLNTPFFMQEDIVTRFSPSTTQWNISNKSKDNKNVKARTQFGTNRKNAYQLIEDCLNLRDTKVWDKVDTPDGVKSELNRKETMLAQQKQELLRNSFKDWVFKDPVRREALVEKYNVFFNSTKPREYDGSHLSLVGINSEIKLRPHQKNAVAHAIYGGNTLFAHEVGAGKTFEMIATAMESKRLGLCNKSLIAVPNHLTEQMGNDFMKLYPAANILVAKKEDFSKENRKKLCAKIATGDFDAVIIGHSQLIKIPVSPERQERLMKEQIHEIVTGISELKKEKAEHFHVKQLEITKKSLEAKLKKLINSPKRDDVVNFEELGVDKLIVDEAHLFKNLYLNTKMRNISGISTNDNVQKTADLYMKCQYLDEITGGKGIVFATGTPVSNSMTEIYSMMKYLQSDMLDKTGLKHFDAWAANFGETVTAMELAPEGTGYRAKTRFAKFFNLPELMNLFKECADIKTADVLNLKTPECTVHNIAVKPTNLQSEMVQNLSERAAKVHNREVDPTEDNMLKITTDGRKIGLDQRLIDPLFPDEAGTKVNACVDNVFKIWNDTKPDRLTQLIFCDFSTPKADDSFNLYDDIRNKLTALGIPKEEVAFIHEAKNENQKDRLFAKVRSGEVRVLIGSTAKMGAGTNIQDKLVASHDLDCPWKPADMEQRRGRMVRQGNKNKKVDLYRYVTEATFDAYLFQTLENKQKFIGQIMTSKAPVRSCEDVDESALSYAEVKALCAGNPDIKEKMELDVEVSKLKMLKSNYINQQYSLEDSILKHYPKEISTLTSAINSYKKDIETIKQHPIIDKEKLLPMKIGNQTYTDKELAGKALLNSRTLVPVDKQSEPINIGSYRGFDMLISLQHDFLVPYFRLDLKGAKTHSIELGDDVYGNLTRINNVFDSMEKQLSSTQDRLSDVQNQLTFAKEEMSKPFPQEAELQQKLSRLEELDIRISMEKVSEKPKSIDKKEQMKDNSVIGKLEKMKKEVSTNIRSNPSNEMSL